MAERIIVQMTDGEIVRTVSTILVNLELQDARAKRVLKLEDIREVARSRRDAQKAATEVLVSAPVHLMGQIMEFHNPDDIVAQLGGMVSEDIASKIRGIA